MVRKSTRRKSRANCLTQLTALQQAEYLALLLRGASPAVAAQQLELDLFVIVEAIAEDEEFRVKVDAVYDALSQNVAARLYQEAMKGSVTAMTLWLKNRPPPEWPDHPQGTPGTSGLDLMSDEELLRLARLENVTIPAELEAGLAATGGASFASVVSSAAPES